MDGPDENKDINTTSYGSDEQARASYSESIDTGGPTQESITATAPSTSEVTRDPAKNVQRPTISAPTPVDAQPSSRRFLAAYITSILSALSLLSSGAFLGYSLLDHFLTPEGTSQGNLFFDLASVYLALITSMIIFGALYLLTSQYVARQVAKDTIGVRDWRAYRVVYAGFSALLLTIAASIVGSLLYIPLAVLLVVQDYAPHEIWVQLLGGLHVLVWIGVLIWQERLVKHGKNVASQGIVTVILVLVVVALSSIFLVASKTDERYDKRTSSDLNEIESAIDTYKSKSAGKLPTNLKALDLSSSPLVEKRLDEYKYTVKEAPASNSTMQNRTLQRSMLDSISDEAGPELLNGVGTRYTSSSERASYELCATFRTQTTEDKTSPLSSLLTMGGSESSFHVHNKGEVCFQRD